MSDDKQLTRKQVEEELTAQNRDKPFEEYPKMKYHPDGRQVIVNSSKEESELGAEFLPNPELAQKEKAKRDAAAEKRAAQQLAKGSES